MPTSLQMAGQPLQFLTAHSYLIGRGSNCNIMLPESDGLISREHARLERGGDGFWVLKDTSTNGTFVNGDRIVGQKRLNNGDQISIGKVQIGFQSTEKAQAPVNSKPAPTRATETVYINQNELNAHLEQREKAVSEIPAPAPISIPPSFLKPTYQEPPAVVEPIDPVPVIAVVEPVAAPAELITAVPEPQVTSPAIEVVEEKEVVVLPAEILQETASASPIHWPEPVEETPHLASPPASSEFVSEAVPAPITAPVVAPREPVAEVQPPVIRVEEETWENSVALPPASNKPVPKADPTIDILPVNFPPADIPEPAFIPTPVADANQSKQCTRCRTLYETSEQECPSCGHAGFKMKAVAPPSASPVAAPAVSPAPVDPAIPAPTPQSTPANSLQLPPQNSQPQIQAAPAAQSPVPPQNSAYPAPAHQNQQPGVSHVVHHVAVAEGAKNPGTALIISLVICGGGQIYNGQIAKGVVMMVTNVMLVLFCFIPYLGLLGLFPLICLHIFNLVDAYQTADRLSREAANRQAQRFNS